MRREELERRRLLGLEERSGMAAAYKEHGCVAPKRVAERHDARVKGVS
jgi:hypothetical protein